MTALLTLAARVLAPWAWQLIGAVVMVALSCGGAWMRTIFGGREG